MSILDGHNTKKITKNSSPDNDSIQLSLYSREFRGTQDIVESQQIVPSLSMQENCFFHMFLIFITILLMRQSKLLTNEEKK